MPQAFFWRRMHSLMGLAMALFLIEHLLTNSRAALFTNQDGEGFIHDVNWIHSLPYLPLLEVAMLAVPFIIHIVWGIAYLRTSRANSFPSDGAKVALAKYERNWAYTFQRLTSWILIVGLAAHVYHMRFLEQPAHAETINGDHYVTRVDFDEGLYTLTPRIGTEIYDTHAIERQQSKVKKLLASTENHELDRTQHGVLFDPAVAQRLEAQQIAHQEREFLHALEYRPLEEHQVMLVTPDFGTAILMIVRDTFKSPWLMALYTLFVLSAAFHAANGVWTFLISWGITLTPASQRGALMVSRGLMAAYAIGGLATIYLTYWVTLRA